MPSPISILDLASFFHYFFFFFSFFFTSFSICSKCLISEGRTVIGSLLSSLNIEKINNNKRSVNGKADTREADCNASKPPAYSRTVAIADMRKPQIIFTANGGNKLPFVVILAKMYVAESPEVTRKVNINKIDNAEMSVLNGTN